MTGDASPGAKGHAKSNALCNVGMFLVVFCVVAPVLNLPLLKNDVDSDKLFWMGIAGGGLCFIASAYLKATDFAEFVKAVNPFRRAQRS